jgi:hypothetical protein
MNVQTCADYQRITYANVTGTWGETYGIGWDYYGETSSRSWNYYNYSKPEYIASRSGSFKFCIQNNWSCPISYKPWIETRTRVLGVNDTWSYGGV